MRRTVILVMLALLLIVGMTFGQTYERNETLFAGGGLWGPPTNWNPITPWSAMTGVVGLVYETLYMYNPFENELEPWLAVNGEWLDENTYQLELREGIKWTDGEKFDADDVKFTFDIADKYPGVHYSTMWEWLKEVEKVDDYTLKFHFEEPLYHEWSYNLWQLPMIPEHIWSKKTEEEILSGANENPIGTGCYLTESHGQDRQIFVRNENWWATDQLGLKPGPKRIVYIAVNNNSVALGMILKGELDISNFFLPGVPRLVQAYPNIHTFYDEPPYMLSDNTAFLFLNTTRKPLDDPEFRKALAFAINSDDIAKRVFENQVLTSNPLGYLPIDAWMQYYDEKVVEKYGFRYDPPEARRILAKAGYEDVNGDGYLEAPDGSEIKLSIIVPFGWTDWMESIKIIARNFNEIGINAEPLFPDYGRYQDELYGGDFDMAINNFNSNISNTVWTLYHWLFYPLRERMTSGNFGRYDNPEIEELLHEFNRTPMDKHDEAQEILSRVQEIFLKDMPSIPLWYNGMWFQASTDVWTNWPSEDGPVHYPTTWAGKWQLGGVYMLCDLEAK